MAIFNRMSKEQLKQEGFTHEALAFGVIPVYISDPDREHPEYGLLVATRNWMPEWPLDLMNWIYIGFLEIVDPYGLNSEGFPFKVTGKIK